MNSFIIPFQSETWKFEEKLISRVKNLPTGKLTKIVQIAKAP